MKLIFSFLSVMVAKVVSEIDTNARDEAGLFWERELQASATAPPNPAITPAPTPGPTPDEVFLPCNLSAANRRNAILAILAGVSVPATLATNGSPQQKAADWLIGEDERVVCPGDEKLIQRYVMALFYYSTEGASWTLCAQGDGSCQQPNVPYLSGNHECEWFGSGCDDDLCMTDIIFEANNVAGSLPFELEQLEGLEVISLEQGALQRTIPSNLGTLGSLRILDLDFNAVTGTIPEEIYGLTSLQQLDLNSNRLTGTISDSVGTLSKLQLLQLYENLMTGTIPETLGQLEALVIGEFYNNTFTGAMPDSVCDNRTPNGLLNGLTSDCFPNPQPQISCDCCTGCAVF